MIDILKKELETVHDIETRLNRTREFLQKMILKIMFEKDHFKQIAFTGGTALRVIYGIRRFSEDIDLSLINPKGFHFPKMSDEIGSGLNNIGIKTEIAKVNTLKNVNSFFARFPGLPAEMDIGSGKGEKIHIKVEIDTNPPAGGVNKVITITEPVMMALMTFDLSSMFATKLHACFYRKYMKGRDYYDLIWYLGKRVIPNLPLLKNAILQTENQPLLWTKGSFYNFFLDRLGQKDLSMAKQDVQKLIEDKSELKILNKETILGMAEYLKEV